MRFTFSLFLVILFLASVFGGGVKGVRNEDKEKRVDYFLTKLKKNKELFEKTGDQQYKQQIEHFKEQLKANGYTGTIV